MALCDIMWRHLRYEASFGVMRRDVALYGARWRYVALSGVMWRYEELGGVV